MKKTLSTVEDLAGIRERIGSLAPTDARRWGAMNVHQMVCHLSDSYGLPLGERVAAPMKQSVPLPLLKWFALQAPMKWPKGVPTVSELDQCKGGGTSPVAFEADVAVLLDKLGCFAAASGPWPPHPIFAGLTTSEWMRWGYLHVDHHLRQFGR